MNERLPLVAIFNDNDLEKINHYLDDISIPLCKVPFGKRVDDHRLEVDTLPFHITIFSWNIKKLKEVKSFLSTIYFKPFQIVVENIKIVKGNDESFELRFVVAENIELKRIQNQIFNSFSSKVFNPSTYNFHITIHINKNRDEIFKLEENIRKKFKPFTMTIDTLKLFSIYPAIPIEEYHCIC